MGIEWLPGPDYGQLHASDRLLKGCLIWVPVVAAAAWLAWMLWRQV